MADAVDFKDLQRRMEGAVSVFKADLASLRTGRASGNLLDPIQVEAYGSHMPLNQVATISVPEPRMLSVQVWDKSMVQAVDRAIRESNLGFNPIVDGTNLRIPLPELNEERRRELTKVAAHYAENARVAVRNVRHSGMDQVKKHKDGMSEDDQKFWQDAIQELTDTYVGEVDKTLANKQEEIMQV